MNGDQIEGTARETIGKLREGAGSVIGDDRMQAEGMVDQVAGALQHGYGEIKDGAKTLVAGAPALEELGTAARKLGRQIDDTLQDQFGASAPFYVLAGAVAFLGVALLWAGRDRD